MSAWLITAIVGIAFCSGHVLGTFFGRSIGRIEGKREQRDRPERLLKELATLYATDPTAVACVCDEALDPSGRLLGEVRDAARLDRETDHA